MKIKELFEGINSSVKTIGEMTINGMIVAPNGEKRKVWDGDFDVPFETIEIPQSLEGCPEEINGAFTCSMRSKITSFKGAPKKVNGTFIMSECNISSIEGLPKFIEKNCFITKNSIKTLKNIHKEAHEIGGKLFIADSVESNILGVLKIKNLKELIFLKKDISYAKKEISNIINKYLPNPTTDQILDCQNELIEAGFEEYAEL